jgi:pyruvate kinase
MLETMIENPAPTRAEASDVANAIIDGTDAVMLSGETAIGRHPEQVINVMTQIAREIESSQFVPQGVSKMLDLPEGDAIRNAICAASSYLSYLTEEKGLAVFSSSGMTLRILSKFRPQTNIYAASNKDEFCNRMALLHNVYPVLIKAKNLKSAVSSVSALKKELLKRKLFKKGDKMILLTGSHYEIPWHTDTIKVSTI